MKSSDEPPVKELDISGECSKRITEAFAISVGGGRDRNAHCGVAKEVRLSNHPSRRL
jgi:hypothetical protein